MPIYVTQILNFGQTRIDSFSQRGLTTSTSSTVREADIVYIGLRDLERTIVLNCVEYFGGRIENGTKVTGTFPIPCGALKSFGVEGVRKPDVIVRSKDVSRDAANQYGLMQDDKPNTYVGQLTLEGFSELYQSQIDPFINTPAGNTNLSGFAAWVWAVRGLKMWVRMMEGHAKLHDWCESSIVTSKIRSIIGTEKGKVDLAGMQMAVEDKKDSSVITENWGVWAPTYGVQKLISLGDVKTELKFGFAYECSTFTIASKGYLLEYFPGMMRGDSGYVYDKFMHMFSRCVSSDQEAANAIYPLIRRGHRSLADTQAGIELQHMYFGIELCSNGGVVKYLYDESQYVGFVFCPYGDAKLLVKNVIIEPLDSDKLVSQVHNLVSHFAAIQSIGNVLRSLTNVAGNRVDFEDERARHNPRYIRNIIMTIASSIIAEQTVQDALIVAIKDLRFTQTFWDIKSPARVLDFINALSSSAVWSDEPMYVSLNTLTARNSIVNYLCAFGPTAPSIFHGDTMKQIAEPSQDDPNLRVVGDKRVVPYIPFYVKGLMAAAGDWASVSNTRAFKYFAPKKNTAGIFSDRKKDDGIISSPLFDTFYASLRLYVAAGRGGKTKDVQSGRKRAGEEMAVDGPSKKKFFAGI